MSQAGTINLAAGPVPPQVPTSFVTNVNSPAIPIANVLDVFGGSTTTNNNNGIQTDGSSGSNVLTVQLTNRIFGSTTTSDGAGQTQLFSTFPLGATPGTYIFDTSIVAFNVTDNLSAAYKVSITRRTTGVVDVGIGNDTFTEKEEGTMLNVIVTVLTAGNNFNISVTGIAGKVIDWRAVTTYVFVS